jgi:hypothetical protein
MEEGFKDNLFSQRQNSPLGEPSAGSVVLLAPLVEVVQALSAGLAGSARDLNGTLVDLDTGDDTLLLHDLDEGGAIVALVEESLLIADGAGDPLAEAGGGEEQLTVVAAVLLGVLNADRVESLGNRVGGLVSGEDTLARGGNGSLKGKGGKRESGEG